MLAAAAPASAQAPEWRRACNPSHYVFGAPGSVGRGQTRSAGVSLAELNSLREVSVTSSVDLARCQSLANDPAAAILHATRALELLRSERASTGPASPSPGAAAAPLVAGRDVPVPARTREVAPVPPSDIAEIGIEGFVFVDAMIDREGRVREPRIAGSIPALDRAALDAVRQWRYEPPQQNGKPVSVAITLIVPFGPETGGRAVDALDAARFFFTRRQDVDVEMWLTRAVEILQAEQADWAGVSEGARRGLDPARSSGPGQIVPPVRIHGVQPIYPRHAKAAGFQGRAIIEAIIGKDGSVKRARVVKSEPILAAAALAAVKQWRYSPTLVAGAPVEVRMTVTVTFALNQRLATP